MKSLTQKTFAKHILMLCLLCGERYQSIRRTMTGRGSRDFHTNNNSNHNNNSTAITTGDVSSPVSDSVDGPTVQTTTTASTTATTTTTVTSGQTTTGQTPEPVNLSRVLLELPAVRFLCRTDFFNLMHMNDEALAQYNSSSSLKHMVTKIRREGQHSLTGAFERYQHNRDLVSLINKFAETNRELPSGEPFPRPITP